MNDKLLEAILKYELGVRMHKSYDENTIQLIFTKDYWSFSYVLVLCEIEDLNKAIEEVVERVLIKFGIVQD